MENTTSGASANTAEKPVTAELSQASQKKGKRSTRKTKEPITPAEAAELLTSALSYCLESGLKVVGYNEGMALRLSIEGLEYSGNQIRVINVTPLLINVTSAEINVTS